MFVTTRKNETLAEVRDRLAGNKASGDTRLRLEKLLVKVNPGIDFAKLAPGTVLTIPDSPLVRGEGDNPAISILDELERDLLEGLKEMKGEVDDASKRERATIAASNRFLGSAAGRGLVADRALAGQLSSAKKAMAARARAVEHTAGDVGDLLKQIRKDFAEMRNALDR